MVLQLHDVVEEMRTQDVDCCTPTRPNKKVHTSLQFHHTYIDPVTTPLSKARQNLISFVDTDWFMFIDDDMTYTEQHFKQLASMIDDKTGAIESNSMVPEVDILKRQKIAKVTRGWTGFTLIRTRAVKDWNPPSIARYEDEHLRQHILKKGYTWKRALDCVVIHNITHRGYPGPSYLHFQDGYGAWFAMSPYQKFRMFAKTPLFGRHGYKRLKAQIYFLKGMLYALFS